MPPAGSPPVSVIAVALLQMALKAARETVGKEFTVTVTLFDAVQPAALVPVTVYVVVADGFVCTLEPVVLFNPVPGDHKYVLAPEAVNEVALPAQIALVPDMEMTGSGFTVIATEAFPVQPLVVLVATTV